MRFFTNFRMCFFSVFQYFFSFFVFLFCIMPVFLILRHFSNFITPYLFFKQYIEFIKFRFLRFSLMLVDSLYNKKLHLYVKFLFYTIPYFFLNLSALPPVVSLFKFPVQKAWQLEHISTFKSFFVEPTLYTFPQAHVIVVSSRSEERR